MQISEMSEQELIAAEDSLIDIDVRLKMLFQIANNALELIKIQPGGPPGIKGLQEDLISIRDGTIEEYQIRIATFGDEIQRRIRQKNDVKGGQHAS
jgi:hypothetical protein